MPYELVEEEPSVSGKVSGIGKAAARHGARTASNIATRAIGLPGDIFSLVNEFIAKPASKAITGKEGVPYEETFLGKALPTTETHRRGIEEKTGEFLKPQNKIEKFADDVIEDATLLLNPSQLVKGGAKVGSKLFKSFAKSLGANIAGETVKQVSGGEGAANLTKAGALLALSIIDQPAAAKQVGQLYKEAEKHLPSNAKTEAKTLSKNVESLEQNITKGRPVRNLSPSEKFVLKEASKIKRLVNNGEISVEQAIAQKRSLNQELSTLYKEVPKRSDQKKVRNLAKQLNGYLNQAIGDYGKKNPKFYKPYKDADQAFGALAKSNLASNWMEKNIGHNPITTGLLHVLIPAAGAIGGVAVYYPSKIMYQITKSPVLRKIYGNTLKAATKEDKVLFNKYLKELDDGLQQVESESKYEFID